VRRPSADSAGAMALRPVKRVALGAPPKLVRRFALYAGIALIVAAVCAYFFVRRYSEEHAEKTAIAHTEYLAESILPNQLDPIDFTVPATGRRLAALDRLARRTLLSPGIVRVKFYDPDGRVIYSSDHYQIGHYTLEPETVTAAFRGGSIGDVTDLNSEGGTKPDLQVLESYSAVAIDGRPVGVLELYGDYSPIAEDARSIFIPLAAGIAIVLIGLYFSFFPILRRVTRTMRHQLDEIEHKAFHDHLTDLPNRAKFNDRAEAAVRRAKDHGGSFAVMLIDLDRFKDVNDSLGHDSGDRLLSALASALPSQMRKDDTVARLGGDEFGVLALDIGDASAVLALAQKVRGVLAEPRVIDGVELQVGASIGIALYPDHGSDAETLVRRADVAMYRSKQTQAPALYDKEHDHYSPARLSLVAELHRAISKGELFVSYQPQVDPASHELRAVEALVRWRHPKRGLLMPNEFIPLAEHTGMIRELTAHVLDRSLEQCRAWRDEGLELGMAVNISPRDLLDSRLPEEVESLLAKHDVEPGDLELEITEETAITDLPRARAILSQLSQLGVKLAVDDFGAGNSSLAYLRRLPVTGLKIDRSLISRMRFRPDDAAIVDSTIRLAHALGLKVTAEGVETVGCCSYLAEVGCELAQGFYFGRAMSAEDIATMARDSRVSSR
jgi:diguanylate cyclase (GGDEF)-like protein